MGPQEISPHRHRRGVIRARRVGYSCVSSPFCRGRRLCSTKQSTREPPKPAPQPRRAGPPCGGGRQSGYWGTEAPPRKSQALALPAAVIRWLPHSVSLLRVAACVIVGASISLEVVQRILRFPKLQQPGTTVDEIPGPPAGLQQPSDHWDQGETPLPRTPIPHRPAAMKIQGFLLLVPQPRREPGTPPWPHLSLHDSATTACKFWGTREVSWAG